MYSRPPLAASDPSSLNRPDAHHRMKLPPPERANSETTPAAVGKRLRGLAEWCRIASYLKNRLRRVSQSRLIASFFSPINSSTYLRPTPPHRSFPRLSPLQSNRK